MAQMKKLDVWYARLNVDEIDAQVRASMKKGQVKQFEKNMAKARSKDSIKAFNKLVQVVDGRQQLVGDPPLIVPIDDLLPSGSTTRSTKQSTICCAPIAAHSQAIIDTSWKDSATRTRRARWSEWAVSAHAPGFC